MLNLAVVLTFEALELPPIGTNAYLIQNPETSEAVLVDAPLDAYDEVTKVLAKKGVRLVALLMTHGHWDHLLDGWRFMADEIPIYGNSEDQHFFEDPAKMASFAMPGIDLKPMEITHWINGGDTIDLLGTSFEVRHVPGHCPGSLLFWLKDQGIALVGDAIFAGSIGRTDLPLGDFSVLEKSIQEQIYTLPESTVLCPGHGPATTVEREMASNPHVRPAK
jgi:glyoxylase-like metal-dependent hydrolase (beta-lactamase superfamily II)|tara:strand:- start:71 stop:730 length:660 start_codon:yes stop_codon:yes gene_type:complete